MVYEAKDGQFVCFQKESKAGKIYYSGAVRINDKNFNISIFEKVTVKGDKFLSGIIDECKTQSKQEVKEVKQDDVLSTFLNDDIPF